MNKSIPVALAVALCLGGCAVGPDYARPPLDLPGRYTATPPVAEEGEGVPLPRLSPGLDIPAQWWAAFRNEPLNALVAQSLAGNPGVEAAEAALRAARENEAAQRAAFWPVLTAGLAPTRQRVASHRRDPK